MLKKSIVRIRVAAIASLLVAVFAAEAQQITVLSGPQQAIEFMQSQDWWGEVNRGDVLEAPHMLLTGISPRWQTDSKTLTVQTKKAIFYRAMLPLVLHANEMVLDRRERLAGIREAVAAGKAPAAADSVWIAEVGPLLKVKQAEGFASAAQAAQLAVLDELLYKLDVIPAGLVLGQAAYESGYGTSRFAIEGNSFFGQWTYGGTGIKPAQQREELGDHRIAAFDWPFDSVRGYFINLSSHPAYEPLRKIRAEKRAAGEPLDSLTLAEGLLRYSERGQEYVDTLKGIIRVNKLDIADTAVFRDEPVSFVIGAPDQAAAEELRGQIEELRENGELQAIIARMRLE